MTVYHAIAQILLSMQEVSPAIYYMVSDGNITLDQCQKRLKPAMAHLRKVLAIHGILLPETKRDGRLIYNDVCVPPNVEIDFAVAERVAGEGFKALAKGDLERAGSMADRAIEICGESSAAWRLRHHTLLREDAPKFRDILTAARQTAIRRGAVRQWIERLRDIQTVPEWQIHRETIDRTLFALDQEHEELLMLALRTEARIRPELHKNAEDRAVGELCVLAVLAQRLGERYREYFRNAVAEHQTTRRLAGEITKGITEMSNRQMPIQMRGEDIFRIALAQVSLCIADDIQGDAFNSLRPLRKYIRRRCGQKVFILSIADQFGQDQDLVALVYRKWSFERSFKEEKGQMPNKDEIRRHLRLARPNHESRYWKMLATEETLSQERVPLTVFSMGTESGFEEIELKRSRAVTKTSMYEEDISDQMVLSILRKAGASFQENLELWMTKNGGIGTALPAPSLVADKLDVSIETAQTFVAYLKEIMAIAGDLESSSEA